MTVKTEISINPKLIKAFVQATQNVLSTMIGLESTINKPTLKTEPAPSYDVSGIVGFSGEVKGSVVISLRQETAIKIVEAFTYEKLDLKSEEFADAIGELSNMIAGNAKKDFGLDASISIPNVIVGTGHTISRLSGVPCVIIPCTSPMGDFAVEVNIKEVSNNSAEG